ncbi:MAG: hypothetical protein ROO73_03015 [Roseivirga sp.]
MHLYVRNSIIIGWISASVVRGCGWENPALPSPSGPTTPPLIAAAGLGEEPTLGSDGTPCGGPPANVGHYPSRPPGGRAAGPAAAVVGAGGEAEEVEAKRQKEEAEAKRQAEEAEAKRQKEEAEAKRQAEEEAKRQKAAAGEAGTAGDIPQPNPTEVSEAVSQALNNLSNVQIRRLKEAKKGWGENPNYAALSDAKKASFFSNEELVIEVLEGLARRQEVQDKIEYIKSQQNLEEAIKEFNLKLEEDSDWVESTKVNATRRNSIDTQSLTRGKIRNTEREKLLEHLTQLQILVDATKDDPQLSSSS